MSYDPSYPGLYLWETHAEANERRHNALSPDPVRPPETDEEPWTVAPLVPDRSSARLGFLLALACGFIAGVLVMWVLR